MRDTTVTKVDSAHSPRGAMGQKYLASSVHVGMRLWEDEAPGEPKPAARREYETVGYVIRGRAELTLEGQTVRLEPGDSWVVPRGAEHSYHILESFTAVGAPAPPAPARGRDAGGGGGVRALLGGVGTATLRGPQRGGGVSAGRWSPVAPPPASPDPRAARRATLLTPRTRS